MINPPVPIIDVPDKFDGTLSVLAYGSAGTGKTEFGASGGKDSVVLFLDRGDLTLQSPGYKKRNPIPPKIAHITEEIDLKTGIFKRPALAFDLVGDFIEWFISSDFKLLTIDDASALNQYAKNKSLDMSSDFKKITESLDKSQKHGVTFLSLDDYQREISMIDWFLADHISRIKEAGKSIVLLAHERFYFKKSGDKPTDEKVIDRIVPSFTGQTFPDAVTKRFDFVWHFSVVNGNKFQIRTIPGNKIAAKTRWSGVFKDVEDSMSLLTLFNRMRI